MGRIQAAVADVEQRVAALKALIVAELENLPDNPKITRLAHNCFVVSSKDLDYQVDGKARSDWSPAFHDFKLQYRFLVEQMAERTADRCLQLLREAAAQHKVKRPGVGNGYLTLHPQVVAYLRAILAK